MPKNYWMIVTTAENFSISRKLRFTVEGLRCMQRRKVQRVEPGDRILYYISGIRTFAATATVTSHYFEDHTPIWNPDGYGNVPYRVHIKPGIVLRDEDFIDARQVAPRMDYVRKWPPENWYLAFQGNLHLTPKKDFLLLEEEMRKIRAKKPSPRQRFTGDVSSDTLSPYHSHGIPVTPKA